MTPDLDAKLSKALRELPRERASPGFTGRAMARLDEAALRAPRRWRAVRPSLAVGLAALALAVGILLTTAHREPPTPEAPRRAEIRRQYLEIQRDLAALRALAEETAPVVYVGGDETVDLYLDLRDLAPAGKAMPARLDGDAGRSQR